MEQKLRHMDINFLFEKNSTCLAKLIITPLSPLSMVNSMPGSHFKCLKEPSKMMLTGLFENILDFHLSINDRKSIRKNIEKELNKGSKKGEDKFSFEDSNSSYLPILSHLFKIDLIFNPSMTFFNDLWKRMYRRSDATVHPKGTPNLDYDLLPKKYKLPLDEKGKINNKDYEDLFKLNIGKFPLYYSTLSDREYIKLEGDYIIKLSIDTTLLELLNNAIEENDLGYLGTNDGWVSLKLEKL